ncbi:20822_t:CDS:2, partial [Dentiscutata erythropus]
MKIIYKCGCAQHQQASKIFKIESDIENNIDRNLIDIDDTIEEDEIKNNTHCHVQ